MCVPTAIAFDVVKCGDSYGVVYELLDVRTMAQLIDQDPGCIPEIGRKSAELLGRLHRIVPGADSGLPNRKEKLLDWVDSLLEFLTPAEADRLRAFIRGIPDRDTFLHGDFNSKNIMARQISPEPGSAEPLDYEFQPIDIGDAAIGHPVFDLAMLMMIYINMPGDRGGGSLTEAGVRHLLGFDIEHARRLWDVMCGTYFALSDPAKIEALTQKLYPYSLLITAFHATTTASGDREKLQGRVDHLMRGRLFPAIGRAQPLDF